MDQPNRDLAADASRATIRAGTHARHTAGLAPGKLQANLAILPERYALDFARFCQRNPKPCPVVGITDTGDPYFRTLGDDIDVRTDAPRYRIYVDGVLSSEPIDIKDVWRDDFVAFALGCSFTFERALMASGIPMRHIEEDVTVSMYRTALPLTPAGPFAGNVVVSMRPIADAHLNAVHEICARYPHAHGTPIHHGDPAAIGVADLSQPDYGDAVLPHEGETPVFWACGVTPQNVLLNARPDICITHAPGHMLITDIDEIAP